MARTSKDAKHKSAPSKVGESKAEGLRGLGYIVLDKDGEFARFFSFKEHGNDAIDHAKQMAKNINGTVTPDPTGIPSRVPDELPGSVFHDTKGQPHLIPTDTSEPIR